MNTMGAHTCGKTSSLFIYQHDYTRSVYIAFYFVTLLMCSALLFIGLTPRRTKGCSRPPKGDFFQLTKIKRLAWSN